MNRTLTVAVASALLLAACTSGGGGVPQTAAPPDPSAPAGGGGTSPAPAATAALNGQSGFGERDATALVIIGGQRFEFEDLRCVTMVGAFAARTVGVEPDLTISIPPEAWQDSPDDWEPPSIRITNDEPYYDFHADAKLTGLNIRVAPGTSQVDEFVNDGFRVSGSATFLEMSGFATGETPEPVKGTFMATCPRG